MNNQETRKLSSVIGRGLAEILRRRAASQLPPIVVKVRPLKSGAIVKTYK